MAKPRTRTTSTAWRHLREAKLKEAQERGLTTCPLCRAWLDYDHKGHPNSPELDHIVPHAAGGTDHASNTRIICRTCNRRLGGKLGNQRSRERKPFTPRDPGTTAAW